MTPVWCVIQHGSEGTIFSMRRDTRVVCYSTWIRRDYIFNEEGDWWEALYFSGVPGYAFLIIIEPWLWRKVMSVQSVSTPQWFFHKGATINDRGRRKFSKWTPSVKKNSSARPLKIFMESDPQNLFFPGECLSKFIFSWSRASNFFFLNFLWPDPQIINGRPKLFMVNVTWMLSCVWEYPMQWHLCMAWFRLV